jgi:hypothetical protein
MKISGRHKSIPKELKIALKQCMVKNTKIVISDICSCRHSYSCGRLRIISEKKLCMKIRGYFGSGIVNFFVKFNSLEDRSFTVDRINY